ARVVALDKTGTLTWGQPEVVEVLGVHGTAPDDVLRLAASADARSEHPLARAVIRRAEATGTGAPGAADPRALPGLGVRARVDGETVYVGRARLFAGLGASDDIARPILARTEAAGRTAVLVGRARDGEGAPPEVVGVIAIADGLRPGAGEALQ